MTSNIRFFSLACAILCTCSASAGSVRTLDGKTIEGDLRVENGRLLLVSHRGETTQLDLANILSATFYTPPKPNPLPLRPPQPQHLDSRWKTQDVGPTGTPGSVALLDGKYSVAGAGSNIKGVADSFFFVYQELRGDGQIVARLTGLQLINPDEKAGIMIREKFNERGSKCAFLYFKPQDGSSFAWRAEPRGEMSATPPSVEDRPPAWLKLTRQRDLVTAYKSLDGETWVRIGPPQELPMELRVFVGLAVCSRDTNAACVATFSGVAIQSAVSEDPPPKPFGQKSDPAGPTLGRGVVLRSGAILADVHIESADDQAVHLIRKGKPLTIATSDVARIILAPVRPQQMAKIPPTGSGVLLTRGDFMEGELESLRGNRVKLNSIVFGPSDLAAGSEVAMIVLHEIAPAGSQIAWVVRTRNGLVYMAKTLRMDRNAFVIEDELDGQTRVPAGMVTEITAGGARFDLLPDLRPDKVDVPTGASTAAAYSVPDRVTLAGHFTDRPLLVSAPSSLEYSLAGKYKVFLARAGVPEGIAPLVAVRVVVSVDGKEVFHTPPLTSFDEPASIAVPVADGQRLTLRVEAVGDASLPASAVIAEGIFVK